jgi:Family of unknown function (DUF6152)
MRNRLLLAGFGLAVPLLAHHSISGTYDTHQQVKIEGTLVDFNFRNPHSFVELDGKDPKTGQATRFSVEWGSIKRLKRQGIAKETLKPGDRLVILGNPARKTGNHTLHMVGAVRKADGWTWGRVVN